MSTYFAPGTALASQDGDEPDKIAISGGHALLGQMDTKGQLQDGDGCTLGRGGLSPPSSSHWTILFHALGEHY